MKLKLLRYLPIGLLLAINMLWISFFVSIIRSPKIGPTHLLGNRDANIQLLPEPESNEDYSFAVIGDSRNGIEIYEVLIERTKNIGAPNFAIHLGDFVPHTTAAEYGFFIHEFNEHPEFPLFVVPGNHDVKPSEDKGRQYFENAMGPREVWFKYRDDLFIIVDNAMNPNKKNLEPLNQLLSEESGSARNIFLFMHHPLFLIDKDSDSAMVDINHPLHQMLKKWNVRYVFAGHYLSYIRKEVDGIEYVVTAGGGAPLYGRRGFYHAVLINVHDTHIQENLITSPYQFGLDDEVANLAYRLFYEIYQAKPIVFSVIMIFGQLLLFWIFFHLFKKGKSISTY